jgi:riboflavin synthase
MFTGIVEELGTVEGRQAVEVGGGNRLRISASKVLDDVHVGDSMAVNGCCLTVTAFDDGWWEADLSDETLRRTTLGQLQRGDRVNLERPVRLQDRLGGHLVQGHVDGVGEIVTPAPDLAVRMPSEQTRQLLRYVVEKGSITVDGVSLTVVTLTPDGFAIAVIPHTAEITTLGGKRPGDTVNLEVDVTVKYVERLLTWHDEAAKPGTAPSAGEGREQHVGRSRKIGGARAVRKD